MDVIKGMESKLELCMFYVFARITYFLNLPKMHINIHRLNSHTYAILVNTINNFYREVRNSLQHTDSCQTGLETGL